MSVYIARSYAKINLGLFIKNRLPNGYHDIETGFTFIDWSDRLEVSKADKTTIETNDESLPTGKQNLIIKAIHAFNSFFGYSDYFHIKLQKNIPAGAGLGGGSSNAAVMLLILNKHYGNPASEEQLVSIGSALGADVPVFLKAQTAIGTGTGTELNYLPIQPDTFIITVWPEIHSNTAEAYQFCEPLGEPAVPLDELLTETPVDEWGYLLRNDLEPAVIPRYPEIGNLKDQFYDSGAIYAAMSGSGSAVFGLFEQEFVAKECYQYLISLGYKANLTQPGFQPDHNVFLKA